MNLTIKARLVGSLAALAIAMTAIGATGAVATMISARHLQSVISDRVDCVKQLKGVSDAYAVNIVDAANKVRSGAMSPEEGLRQVTDARAAIEKNWDDYLSTQMTDEETRIIAKVKAAMPAADKSTDAFEALLRARDIGKLSTFVTGDLYPAVDPVTNSLSELVNLQIRVAREEGEAANRAAHTSFIVMAFVALGGLGVLAFAAFVVLRQVCRPLGVLEGVMRKLAGGDNEVEIPGIERADELGQMAGAVEVFKSNAIAKIKADAEAEEAKAQAEAERKAAQEAAIAQEQGFVVGVFGAAMEKLASGDLTFRVKDDLPPAYEKLRGDFNGSMAKLEETMTVIVGNGSNIHSSSQEITSASDDLAKRTQQQAASLEETAAALDQITATVRKTAQGATEAREVVASTKKGAEAGGEVVGQARTAMTQIEDSAQKINQIIGVIDEIAFQTNLLALNAGVEAARAGDAGKGFAVVASEVRALAQRSADAAKEIKALISDSTVRVSDGVRLVGDTGAALERIVTEVAQINALVTEIAQAAQEQASGLGQVNTAVNQMDQVTQQNAAMVEQSTAASHALAREATSLSELMAQFRLSQRPASAKYAGGNPVHAAQARVAQMITTGQAKTEDWAEF